MVAGMAHAQPPPDDAEQAREAELFGAPPSPAADREAEMFGEPAPAGSSPKGASPEGESPNGPAAGEAAERDAALLGGSVIDETPIRVLPMVDPLTIGGRLWLRLDSAIFEDVDADEQRLAMPNLLDVYLDARPADRVRAYASARLTWDPTVDPSDDAALGQAQTGVALNELWLRFDAARRVFFTVGAQRVRWGTARVWNPTDVLNLQRLDPLAPVDLRTGVPLVRAELPIEALGGGLTVAALLDGASTLGQVGGAARLQMATDGLEVSVLVSVLASVRADEPLRLGGDFSAGLGPIDVYGEALVAHGGSARRWVGDFDLSALVLPRERSRADDWIVQAVGGFEWPIAYGDDDLIVLGAEYLYNDTGYADAALYPWLIAQGDFDPFYLGRHYLAAFAVLAGPGSWNDTSVVLTSVNNLSDGTGVARINLSQTVRRRLFVEPYIAVLYGESGGEFRFSGSFPDGQGGEVVIPVPLAQVGLWLRVGF